MERLIYQQKVLQVMAMRALFLGYRNVYITIFIYTQPSIARALLDYRYSILDASRERARELGINKGCLYSWRTINGNECSAYYPAGTAQFHINADIAYGIRTYFEATNDEEFMMQNGLEILIETARFWVEFEII